MSEAEETTMNTRDVRQYRSPQSLGGLPLIHVSLGGRDQHSRYRPGHARGIIAIGDIAVGFVAVGGVAVGLVAIGAVAAGLLAVGAVAIGVVAVGGVAVGLLAVGAVAAGVTVTAALSFSGSSAAVLLTGRRGLATDAETGGPMAPASGLPRQASR